MSDCRQPLVCGMVMGCRLDVVWMSWEALRRFRLPHFKKVAKVLAVHPAGAASCFELAWRRQHRFCIVFQFNGLLPSLVIMVISSYQVGQPNDDYLQHLHEELLKEKQDPMWDEDVGFIATHVRALQEKVFAEFQQRRQEHAQLKLLGSQSSDGPQLSPPVVPSFSMLCTVACEAWDAKEAGHSFDMFFQHLYTCSDSWSAISRLNGRDKKLNWLRSRRRHGTAAAGVVAWNLSKQLGMRLHLWINLTSMWANK